MNTLKKLNLIFILTLSVVFVEYAIAFNQVKTYTVADGLLDAVVPVIFQDSRGILWFGSEQGGVSRFDGKTITAYAAISEDFYGRTQKIVEDRWGHIWFLNKNPSHETGFVIRYNGNTFEYLSDGNCLIADKDGDIWVGNHHILTRYTAANRHEIPIAFQLNVGRTSGAKINVIFQSKDSTIWIGGNDTHGALILRLRGDISAGQSVQLSRFNNLPNTPQASAIQTIAQDTADNLWFGGNSFLLRYDGTQFEQYKDISIENNPPNSIAKGMVSVHSDTQGRIWYSNNTQLRWCDADKLHRLGTLSVEAGQESDLHGFFGVEDAHGRLWFGSQTGVHLYENDSNGKDAIDNLQMASTLTDTSALKHKVFQVNDGLGSDNILTIFEAIDGTLWFGHDNGVTALQPNPAIVHYGTRSILGSSSVKMMFPDSMDTIWLSIPGGVARYVPQDDELYKYPLPEINLATEGNGIEKRLSRPTEIVEIFEVEGNLWFIDKPIQHQNGFTFYRIFRYANDKFARISFQISAKIGMNGEAIFSDPKPLVSSSYNPWFVLSGWIFLPTEDGLYRLLPDNTTDKVVFETYEFLPASPDTITSLHTDTQQRLWCHYETDEVRRFSIILDSEDNSEAKIQVEALPLHAVVPVRVVQEDNFVKWFYNTESRMMTLWHALDMTRLAIGMTNTDDKVPVFAIRTSDVFTEGQKIDQYGITTFVFNNSIKTYQDDKLINESPIEIDEIRSALVASDGDIWLATSRGAVRYDGKEVTTYTTEDGFIVDDVRDVKQDNWGNIWFATWGGGLIRYNGNTFESITTKDGLIHNNVSSIHVSNEEDLWFGTEGGATQYRVSRGALPFCRINSVDTGESTTETILTKSEKHTFTEIKELLPARLKNLTIHFQGINPLGGDITYKFRLIGIDSNKWTTVFPGNQSGHRTEFKDGVVQRYHPQDSDTDLSLPQIRYEGLKPGNYTFLIKAYREGWQYTQQPSVLNFTIDKPLWTRWRTYLPYAIVLGVVSTLLFRLIMNRRQTALLQREMKTKEEGEIQRIRDELNEAQSIQMALLPTESPQTQSYDIAGRSIPATEVGGDFFDYLTVANGHTAIAVADAAGKGLRGAMNAVLTNGMLNEIARIKSESDVILTELNNGLAPRMYGRNFIALNLAILDEARNRVDYANGGQPYAILKKGTEIMEIETSDLPLGSMKKVDYDSITFDLSKGDFLILHSDGLIEALNADENMYGTERLIELISRTPNECSAEEMLHHIVQDVQTYVEEAEQYDDLTLVVVKCVKGLEKEQKRSDENTRPDELYE